jgi:hypothetical protein
MKTLIFALLIGNAAFAQTGSGIFGIISNEKKLPISNVQLIIFDSVQLPIATVLTNAQGQYGFDLPIAQNYAMQIINGTDSSQIMTGINIDSALEYVLNFQLNTAPQKQANLMGDKYVKTSKQIEKMPSTDINSVLASTGAFTNDKPGTLRTTSLPTSNVKYIVDGQVLFGSNINLPVGTLNSVQVLQK